jgi:hypothetical protein
MLNKYEQLVTNVYSRRHLIASYSKMNDKKCDQVSGIVPSQKQIYLCNQITVNFKSNNINLIEEKEEIGILTL